MSGFAWPLSHLLTVLEISYVIFLTPAIYLIKSLPFPPTYYHFAMVAIHQLELKFSQPVVAISIFSPYSYHNSIIKLKSHSLYQRNI